MQENYIQLKKDDDLEILKILLENKNVNALGKAFFMSYNEVTNNNKREYMGDVLVSLENNKIYLQEGKNLCERDFKISDIVSFKRISEEGLGEVMRHKDFRKDIESLETSQNIANKRRVRADISQATRSSSFYDNVSADNADIRAKKEKGELEKKIMTENNRLKDETVIRFLQFSNNDYLVISHLNDSTVKAIENKIEKG